MASVNWWIESWVTYSLPVAAVCPCVPGSPATFPVTLPHCTCFRHKQGGGKMVSSRPVQVWVRGVLLHILLSTNHLIHSYSICVFPVFTEIYSVTLCMNLSVYWDEEIWGHKENQGFHEVFGLDTGDTYGYESLPMVPMDVWGLGTI